MTRRRFNGHNVGWFWEHCYRESIHLIWPVTNAQYDHYCKHMFGRDKVTESTTWAGYQISFSTPSGGAQLIALSAPWDNSANSIGILAHECFHAAHDILDSRGEQLTDAHSEPYAYLMQSLLDRCLQIITNKPV